MQHNIKQRGYAYSIKPITIDDAQFILDVRLEDEERNKFVHKVPNDVDVQIAWLNKYFARENDYYFVIENNLTGEKEGLIGIYNIETDVAEWGRWVVKKGSMAALESVDLIYKVAFEKLNLKELYTKTVEDNAQVVNFHKSINAKFRQILKDEFELNGKYYNAVEQYVDKEHYYTNIKDFLEQKAIKIFQRNLKLELKTFEFHHIGIATKDIEKEFKNFVMLGYTKESYFDGDKNQGVKGLFITAKKQPKLELLENLKDSTTLDYWLKQGIKMYHFGYIVSDIEKAFDIFTTKLRAKVVSPMKVSQYFGKRICFLILNNMFMVELIEE